MIKKVLGSVILGTAIALSVGVTTPLETFADEEATTTTGTSISITPVSKILQISPSSVYDNSFDVSNDGDAPMQIEVYAAPYSYVYSEDEDAYKLGFNNENSYTQITRWISFKDKSGEYVKKPNFTIDPKSTLTVEYRISTPDNIPAGGQYAVIFAHTLTSTTVNGIRTEASPGMVVYGRSTEGETVVSAEFSDLTINQTLPDNEISQIGEGNRNIINASAKVKNTGNVDFNVSAVLKVEGFLGGASYETPTNAGRMSIIPDAELVVSDRWEDTPSFGLYKATWKVTVGDKTETIEKIIFINPMPMIIISIIVLTIIIVGIIIGVRKHRARRSRLTV